MFKITIYDGIISELKKNALMDYQWYNQLREVSNGCPPILATDFSSYVAGKFISAVAYYSSAIYHAAANGVVIIPEINEFVHTVAVGFKDGHAMSTMVSLVESPLDNGKSIFSDNPTEEEYIMIFNKLYDEIMRLTKQ